jgi:light-regulated signal transduction histidine kinase (bacteriophytochrome)
LERNNTELARSNRELQEFAYVASHDLQEPARKISFYSDYLVSKYEDLLDEKGLAYLQNMQGASRRMRTLISDLLAFAQVERESIQLRHINLNQVTHDVLQDLEFLIEEKGATVQVASMPVIEADEGMLHQLFENLISNAIKYAKEGVKPELRIWSQTNAEKIEIFVEDNGIGFNEQYLPQMFALFQRLHSSGQYEGTGLGLAICQKIVALHNGTITGRSREGEGATFIITLPYHHLAAYDAEKEDHLIG